MDTQCKALTFRKRVFIEKKKGKVYVQAKWPFRLGLFSSYCSMKQYPFVHLGGEMHCESKVSFAQELARSLDWKV